MAWSQEGRPLPSLQSFEHIHKKARTDVVHMDSGIFIPFVPIMQIGAESFLVPLQWWYGTARQQGQLDDEEMFASIVPREAGAGHPTGPAVPCRVSQAGV